MKHLLLVSTIVLVTSPVAAESLSPAASAPPPAASAPVKLDKLVTFEPGRRRVYSKSREELRSVAKIVRLTCPTASVTVEGNAFFPDDEERSIALGQARADIVREQLIKAGMAPESVIAIGHARETLERGNGRHVDLVIDCPR